MSEKLRPCVIALIVCMLSACASDVRVKPIPNNSVENTNHEAKQPELDFISKLVKLSELDKLPPTEKFKLYFFGEVRTFPHPELTNLTKFEGFSRAYKIRIVGFMEEGGNQSATYTISLDNTCISPREFIQKLPSFKMSPNPGPFVAREDDPTKWEFYAPYSIENSYGYITYLFGNNECLREIGTMQKIP